MATKNYNNFKASTTPTSAIDDSSTTLNVTASTGFPDAPFSISVDDEVMNVTSTGTGLNWTVVRGHDGTTAVAHTTASPVAFSVIAEDFPFRLDDTGSFYAQGDISMDGNDIVDFPLGNIEDVDFATTAPVDEDLLSFSAGSFTQHTVSTATQSYPGTPANTYDGNDSTYTNINWPSTGVRSITFDMGSAVTVKKIRFLQGATNYNDRMYLHGSDNNSDWTLVATYTTCTASENIFLLPAGPTWRYWRFEEFGTLSVRWDIYEVEFFDQDNYWVPYTPDNPAFVDNAGTFEAQGDIDLDGNTLAGMSLDDLSDVDVESTSPAVADVLVFQGVTYEELSRIGVTIEDSGAYQAGELPSHTLDDNTSTKFSGNAPGRIDYDFGTDTAISRIAIQQVEASWYSSGFSIYGSDNATDWDLLGTGTGSIGTSNIDFSTATYRYWRVLATSGDTYQRWREVDFFLSAPLWKPEANAFRDDGTGTFDAQGDIDLNGNDLLGGAFESDGAGGFDAQGDIDLDGNQLIGLVGVPTLAGPWETWDVDWTSGGVTALDPGTGGTITGRYQHIGRTVHFEIEVVLGTSPTLSTGNFCFDTPLTAVGDFTGSAYGENSGVVGYVGTTKWYSSVGVFTITHDNAEEWKYNAPFSWGSSDFIRVSGTYETDTEGFAASTTELFDLLHSIKDSADTPDDEFESTTLDAKWTAVAGTTGTVDLNETGEVERYDLASRPGWILMQGGSAAGQMVELRQDFTIPDGECIVLAGMWGWAASDGQTGIANNEQRFGLSLNDNDTAHDAGTYVMVMADADVDGSRGIAWDGTVLGTTGSGTGVSIDPGTQFFVRIDRDGLVYQFYFSTDGGSWMPMGKKTYTTVPNNLWMFAGAEAAGGEPVPIHAVKWIRQGTGGAIDPWNPNARVAIEPSTVFSDTWMDALFERPSDETVHTDDEEFVSALSGNTALTVSGSATWQVKRSLLSVLYSDQTSGDLAAQLWPLTPTSSPVTLETAIRNTGFSQSYSLTGIVLSDGVTASSNLVLVRQMYLSGGFYVSATSGTFTSFVGTNEWYEYSNPVGSHAYLRVNWTGTNTFHCYYSVDGVTWTDFENNADISYTMTPTHFGAIVSTHGGGTETASAFEYLRITESDLS